MSDIIRAFMRLGVVIETIINGMVFGGAAKDPMTHAVRDALIGFMAALSQAQAEATKEALNGLGLRTPRAARRRCTSGASRVTQITRFPK